VKLIQEKYVDEKFIQKIVVGRAGRMCGLFKRGYNGGIVRSIIETEGRVAWFIFHGIHR
jgi:hypothetical protein